MSESETKTEKKKGGKLPIILAIVLMLGGGGFFMMKGGSKPKKKPPITLAKEEIVLPDEYIVNLSDGKTFVRMKVGLRTVEGYKPEEVTKHDAEISDAINMVLKNTKPEETITEKHIKKVKWLIAEKINKILKVPAPEEEAEEESKKGKKKKPAKHEEEEEPIEPPPGGEDWDSYTGPVLKIFFKTFATQ